MTMAKSSVSRCRLIDAIVESSGRLASRFDPDIPSSRNPMNHNRISKKIPKIILRKIRPYGLTWCPPNRQQATWIVVADYVLIPKTFDASLYPAGVFLNGNASPPERIADVIVEALDVVQPDARYLAGPDAKQFLALASSLSDRELDAQFAQMFTAAGVN